MGEGRLVGVSVGDAERHEARALLEIHFAKGRLSTAEHERRHALAGVARVWADVEELFADLPAPTPAQRVETTASSAGSLIFSLCGAVGLPAALVLTVFYGAWWSFLVLGVVVVVAGARAAALEK